MLKMSEVKSLKTKAKAQLVAKYGRLMALYLTGKKGNFVGIPKEAKGLADSILSANDVGSLRVIYDVTRQLKTNSKVQMKDVPALITGRAPPSSPKPAGADYTPVVQSIPSLSFRQHVVEYTGALYLKVEDNKGVVSFKTISSKAEKNDALEVRYGTLGFRSTVSIEEKDVQSKVFLKKGDVPKWEKYFEDSKARLLESEKTRLNKLKGTLTGQERKKCEDKLKEIDRILKDMKADAAKDADKTKKEAFKKALEGKIPLKDCTLFLNGKEQKLGQLDPDAVKRALLDTIFDNGEEDRSASYFVNITPNVLEVFTDDDMLTKFFKKYDLSAILDTVYVIKSEWYRGNDPNGKEAANFKEWYKEAIDDKKANAVAAKANALQKKQQEALKKKQEADAEKARRQREQQEEVARQTAEAARRKAEAAAKAAKKKKEADRQKGKKAARRKAEADKMAARMAALPGPIPKPSAPPPEPEETKDDELEDSGLPDPNSEYSKILRQQDEELRIARMQGGEVPPSDCFDMLSVPATKGEPMGRDQLKVKTAALFGQSTEQQNIYKILFLYALKHQYMKVKGEPIGLVCYRGGKLFYKSPKTAGNEIELKTEDLKDVQLNMKKFREVSDDFLNDNELPVLDDKRKSDFAAKTFPDKFEYVRISGKEMKPKTSIDKTKYTTLKEAGKDIKWLFETAKEKRTIAYVTRFSWRKFFPVTLIARKFEDKGTNDLDKYRMYYKSDDGKNLPINKEDDNYYTFYVQNSSLQQGSRLRRGGRGRGTRREMSTKEEIDSLDLSSAPRFVMDFEEGVTPALFSARIPERDEL